MSNLRAVYYRDSKGAEPVSEFLDSLDPRHHEVIDAQIDLINRLTESNPHLPYPHSSQIEGELRELRCHYGKDHYRILYKRSRQLVVLLHAFRKNQSKVPDKEIKIAKDRWQDFKVRMDAPIRKRPRAAGRDVP